MGDFFNEIVSFLEEYYVYAIGVGLIIILMLIGLLASRRKARKNAKNEGTMANINDVNTGSINDVANTLQSNVMQPVDVVTSPVNAAPVVNEQPAVSNMMNEVPASPVTPEVTSAPTSMNAEPMAPVEPFMPVEPVAPIEQFNDVNVSADLNAPFGDIKPVVEEAKPVDEDQFSKTEIIDFSSLNTAKPVTPEMPVMPETPAAPEAPIMPEAPVAPVAPEVPTDINNNAFTPFVADKSQYSESADILSGESTDIEVPKQ